MPNNSTPTETTPEALLALGEKELDALIETIEQNELPYETLYPVVRHFPQSVPVAWAVFNALTKRTSVYDREMGSHPLLPEILTILSDCEDMQIRWGVAKSHHTPAAVLEKLGSDKVNLVRALVATNPGTPAPLLAKLFNDEKLVRDGLSGNPATPEKYLKLLTDDNDALVRSRVAENPAITDEMRTKLAKDDDPRVRKAIAKTTGDKELLAILSKDEDKDVKAAAINNMKELPA